MHQPVLDLALAGVRAVGGQYAGGIAFLAEGPVILPAVERAVRKAHFAGAAQVIGK